MNLDNKITNNNTNEMNLANEMNINDWFKQSLGPINLNDIQYNPEPENIEKDWRVSRCTAEDIHNDIGYDDYIPPLKKPEEEDEEDPLAKLDLVKSHSNIVSIPIDYETTYKTMDPFFEMLFKPLDDPLFQPNPYLEEIDEKLSQMYYSSLKNE